MKRLVALTAAALFAAGPVFAQSEVVPAQPEAAPAADGSPAAAADAAPAPAVDANVYQVLRAGDRELSCEQLSYEANVLNARLLADQKSAARRAQGRAAGGAVAGGTLRAAGRFGINRLAGRLGPMGWAVAHAANDAASQAAAESIASGNVDPNRVTPEQQRMNHLLGLYKEKSC
jgi:hypothetical protein